MTHCRALERVTAEKPGWLFKVTAPLAVEWQVLNEEQSLISVCKLVPARWELNLAMAHNVFESYVGINQWDT